MESTMSEIERAIAASVINAMQARDPHQAPVGAPPAPWLERVLDHIDYGVACVDDAGRLLHANRSARDAWPNVHTHREPLRSAIRAAGAHGIRRLVDINEAGSRLRIAVVPLDDSAAAGGQVLLVFGKSSVCERLSSYWYGVGKGLTAAEQGVLEEIASGWSPRDIAARHQVSIATIRSQIASVREKTGTGSICALLCEVAQLPPIRCTTATGEAPT